MTTQIPFTSPYPGPRSILVLDNCSIHHSEAVRELVEDQACKYSSMVHFGTIMTVLFRVQIGLLASVLARLQSN